MYILFLTIFFTSSHTTTTTQEFKTFESCNQAGIAHQKAVRETSGNGFSKVAVFSCAKTS